MKRKEIILVFLLFFLVSLVFLYKTVLHGFVPFPGDLLIAEYNPWKTYSYLGYNPGSFPNKAQYFDVLRQLYPWKTISINLLKMGEIPLWNPYNFSGSPLIANFQSTIFYPLNLLYFIIPQIQAWSILVLLQPLLGSFFAYLFARKIGISKIGSLFSSISYGFSSFMTVWLEYNTIGHVILWLPLLLLCIENLLGKIEIKWAITFIFSSVASLFAGHPQVFMYLYIFVFVYVIYRVQTLYSFRHSGLSRIPLVRRRFWSRRYAPPQNDDPLMRLFFFLVLFLLSLGIGSIQIVPGMELIKESARIPHDYNFLIQKILIQPWQFIMMVVPDFFGNPATRNYWIEDTYIGKVTYIGIISLFFVLVVFKNLKKNFILFFIISAGIVLLLSSFNPITAFIYKLNLPFISSSAPTLSIFLFCFCISILSGFGIDKYRSEKWNITRIIKFVAPLIFIILFLWIIVLFAPNLISDRLLEHLDIAKRNLLYATFLIGIGMFLILVGTLKKNAIFLVLLILLAVQTGDLFRYFTKFNPFVPKELVFPKADVLDFLKKESGIDRFWGYGSGNIEANFATQYSLFSTDGYDPLYPRRYGEFIQSAKEGEIQTQFTARTRSDAVVTPGFGEFDLSSNMYRVKVLDLLGVKYILDRVENRSTEKTFLKERFKLIYDKDGWRVFENLKSLPKAFLVSDYKVFKSKEEFEKIFFDKNFDPLKTLLLEEEVGIRFNDLNHLSKTKILSYNPNKIVVDVNADSSQFLFLSDTYYPGWKAFIDSKETKIYRANYAFRAVAVPEGKHEVKFVYDPESFRVGLGISAISFILGAILLIFLFIGPKYVAT